MIRSGVAKFPNSVQLFKFCQKVLMDRKDAKVHDQEVGAVLNFNPSDCSHWKRGEKHVKSVFALAKLATELEVDVGLIHDIASGSINFEEAYFEYKEAKLYKGDIQKTLKLETEAVSGVRNRVEAFVNDLHKKVDFATPPLYLPEILRFFPFVTIVQTDMLDKLSRILRVKVGQYVIHHRKGEMKAQTRLSIVKDLARIIFEGERENFIEQLGPLNPEFVEFEKFLFAANLLAPKNLLADEMGKLDSKQNIVFELATAFWVPKPLISFQLQDIIRYGRKSSVTVRTATKPISVDSIQDEVNLG